MTTVHAADGIAINLGELEMTRVFTGRIVTSGYTDRYLSSALKIVLDGPGYRAEFSDDADAVKFLQTIHGLDWETAYDFVKSSRQRWAIPYEFRGERSSTADVDDIQKCLLIFDKSRTVEYRMNFAQAMNLTRATYYALCWGLYQCNQANALMEARGLRPSGTTQVNIPGFALDMEFDEAAVKTALLAAAQTQK